MIRRFKFEGDIQERVPIMVRRKLDRIGIKFGLDQWRALEHAERLAICHLPIDDEDEREALRLFAMEAVKRACGIAPSFVPVLSTEPPETPPVALVERAKAEGVVLDVGRWKKLDAEQRYVLFKLGAGGKPSHDLAAALREFLPRGL